MSSCPVAIILLVGTELIILMLRWRSRKKSLKYKGKGEIPRGNNSDSDSKWNKDRPVNNRM
jgi:hypothetical protein